MNLMVLFLAQNQAPATSSDLRPVLLTASGALGGVVLTLIAQSINSRHQRIHENHGKAFELRFNLYTTFLNDLRLWDELKTRHEAVMASDTPDRVRGAIDRRKKSREDLRALRKRLDAEVIDLAALSDVAKTQLKEEIRSVMDEKESADHEVERLKRALDNDSASLDENRVALDSFGERLIKAVGELQILADARTLVALDPILTAVNVGRSPTAAENGRIRVAVRRELGIKRRTPLTVSIRYRIEKVRATAEPGSATSVSSAGCGTPALPPVNPQESTTNDASSR